MMRDGTCIEQWHDDDGHWCRCACDRTWRLGDFNGVCDECALGRCPHAKEGVDFEQGHLL